MSQLVSVPFACPRCELTAEYHVFRSLNADRVPKQRQALLDGTFGRLACERCGKVFPTEVPLLYSHWSRGLWVVSEDRHERSRYRELEEPTRAVFEKTLAHVPPALRADVRHARVFLTFGYSKLAEIVRCDEVGIDKGRLECAKLLLLRENAARLLPMGPTELILIGFDAELLLFDVHRPDTGDSVGTLTAGRAWVDEIDESAFRNTHPELFEGLYVDASRYLL